MKAIPLDPAQLRVAAVDLNLASSSEVGSVQFRGGRMRACAVWLFFQHHSTPPSWAPAELDAFFRVIGHGCLIHPLINENLFSRARHLIASQP